MRQLQRAINPAAATPARRTNIPIGVIVEGNERDRFMRRSKPQAGQMMKVARAVKDKFRELRFDLAIKLFDRSWRSGEAEARSPFRGINGGQAVRNLVPGGVEIKMNGRIGRRLSRLEPRLKTGFARARDAQIFCCLSEVRLEFERLIELHDRL